MMHYDITVNIINEICILNTINIDDIPYKYHVNYKHLDNLCMANNLVHNVLVDSTLLISLYKTN